MRKAGILTILFGVALVSVGAISEAQQTAKTFRIGVLNGGTASNIAGLLEAFGES